MSITGRDLEWRYLANSVTGDRHKRNQQNNQDAHCFWQDAINNVPILPLIAAISDGHGSAKFFRSRRGADYATQTAQEELQRFHNLYNKSSHFSHTKRMAEELLPKSIVRNWQEKVRADLAKEPFSEKEWFELAEKEGAAARPKLEENPIAAYGATLLAVLITPFYLLYLQLGDGDVLTVAENGEVSQPFPRDQRFIANETTSLSAANAAAEVRLHFQPLVQTPPALILVSTDGYANSFRDEENFKKVGPDFLQMLRSDGPAKVEQNLADWLTEVSAAGSGDDITLGIIYRMEAIENYHERDRAETIV